MTLKTTKKERIGMILGYTFLLSPIFLVILDAVY